MTASVLHFLYIATTLVVIIFVAKVFVLPWLLRALLGAKADSAGMGSWRDRVEIRYQPLHTYVWMFAWCKLRMDRMFDELPVFLKEMPVPRTALDLGCGFGFAGCAMLEWLPELKLYGIEPSAARVRSAGRVFGERGKVFQGGAPDFEIEGLPEHFDLVLVLDVVHFLTDEEFGLTLRRIRARLNPQGRLILRAPMVPDGSGSITWKVDRLRRWFNREYACYRTVEQIRASMIAAGFDVDLARKSGESSELFWFVASDSLNMPAVTVLAASAAN